MLKNRALVSVILITALVGVSAQAATKKTNATARSQLHTTSNFQTGGLLVIEPNFGFSFISPSDINNAIHDDVDSLQKQGVKSYSVSDFGSTVSYGVASTYRVTPDVGLGLGFSRMSASTDGTAKIGDNSLTGNYDLGATMLTAESRLTFARSNDQKFEAVLAPFVGIGFFSGTSGLSGSALANGSREVNSSAKGAVFGSSITGRYWFTQNIAWSINAGYRYAKSGDLKIDSQRNTTESVGSNLESNGKKVNIDASSVFIGTGLTLAL